MDDTRRPADLWLPVLCVALIVEGFAIALLTTSSAAALPRREQPDHPRLAALGRIGAGLTQLGFFFAFVQEIPSLGRTFTGPTGSAMHPILLFSLGRLVVRGLLLWASIQMLRSGGDLDVLRERFGTVHRLMIGWAAAIVVQSVLIFMSGQPSAAYLPNPIHQVLRTLVVVTMTVVVAFTLGLRFRTLPREVRAEA